MGQDARNVIRKSKTNSRLNIQEQEDGQVQDDARSESTNRKGNRSSSVDRSQFSRFMRLHQSNSFRLKTRLNNTPAPRVFSPQNVPMTFFAKHPLSSDNEKQTLTNKLAYEWKNIYKSLIQVNDEMGGEDRVGSREYATIRDFDNVC